MKKLLVLLAACGPGGGSGSGDCKDKIESGDLVITEVFADYKTPTGGTGADEGKEWFEVYNASDRPIELDGVVVTHQRPDGGSAKQHKISSATIAPGQFYVLGNATQDLVPPYVDYGYGADLGNFFNSDGGQIKLACGDSEIDSAQYDTVKEGHSRELSSASLPDYTSNDDLANWCQGNDNEFDSGNFGTPGSESDCQPLIVGQCSDGGTMRPVDAPLAGELIITEVMPGPAKVADNLGEWFEAKAMRAVDLNGLGLDRAGDSSKPDVITATECIHIEAGDYALCAHTMDDQMNGGLPNGAVLGTFKFAMVAGSATAPGDVQIMSGDTVVDAVTWTKSTSGKALQLDPKFTDAVSNDQPSNFCDATMTYGLGDFGTPSAANTSCPVVVQPGQCMDTGGPRAIVKPAAGQLVISEFLANPANVTGFTDAQREWFELTNTGAAAFDLNGLGVASKTGSPQIVNSAACISVAAHGFAVFARSPDMTVNAMIPKVDATFSFSLVDTNGGIQVLDGATVLDAVTWTKVTSGKSTQLDVNKLDATMNDVEANFCDGKTAYGDMSNLGTPGAANATCP